MRREVDEATQEVILLLQEKNKKKQDEAIRAKTAQKEFLDNASRFIADVLETLKPLEPYGVVCTKERTDVKRDFGTGDITVELEKLIVKEGGGNIFTLEPFGSKVSSDGLRFRANLAKLGARTIIWSPPPFSEHRGWYLWTNEDDKSVNPEYLKLDKKGWMAIIKKHLTN